LEQLLQPQELNNEKPEEVQVKGTTGGNTCRQVLIVCSILAVLVAAVPAFCLDVEVLETERLERSKGAPDVFELSFPALVDAGTTTTMTVVNGEAGGDHRVSAASIMVNGTQVVTPADLSQNVDQLDVTLEPQAFNDLRVELRSAPGSFLMVTITQEVEADAVAIIGPDGGQLLVDVPSSPLHGMTIQVPPGALAEPVVIAIQQADGLEVPFFPLKEEWHTQAAVRILPEHLHAAEPMRLEMPYPDADDDGVVDGTDLPEVSGSLFFMQEDDSEMFRARTTVAADTNRLVGTTDHFSIWLIGFGRWMKGTTVFYWVESVPGNDYFPHASFETEIEEAFEQWSQAVREEVVFQRVASDQLADIYVRASDFCSLWFYMGVECNTGGLASRPYVRGGMPGYSWTVSFNTNVFGTNDTLWVSGSYDPYPPNLGNYFYLPFLRLALHEFGHTMGLQDYEPDNSAANGFADIMRYESGNTMPFESLSEFDRAEACRLYGLDCAVANPRIVPDTGQTQSYTETFGEDSDYVRIARSFTKLDDEGNDLPEDAGTWHMVRDEVTGLIWEVKTADGSMHDANRSFTWYDPDPSMNLGNPGVERNGDDTSDFIEALNAEVYGGYSDWRLPTVVEMAMLRNFARGNPSAFVQYFPLASGTNYWTSTTYSCNPGHAWMIWLMGGEVYHRAKSAAYRVRAVRGPRALEGVFLDNGDGTITDVTTGLMWAQMSLPSCSWWWQALDSCEALELGGYDDWRMPDRNELVSLVDYSRCAPAINPFFDARQARFWTSTTAYSWYGLLALTVDFTDGYSLASGKKNCLPVRCVRTTE
jgi:hypothetical protein